MTPIHLTRLTRKSRGKTLGYTSAVYSSEGGLLARDPDPDEALRKALEALYFQTGGDTPGLPLEKLQTKLGNLLPLPNDTFLIH